MLRLSVPLGVTDNVKSVVVLSPVNWSFVIVTPAAEAIVISLEEVCVKVIPVPSVRLTDESEPAEAFNFKGTLLPTFASACCIIFCRQFFYYPCFYPFFLFCLPARPTPRQ